VGMSRVLVVDDDRTVSDVVARYLIREGHQV
jgi:DNA-binding response OmpR family regulator